MGQYYNGSKIGTCENMYYMRYEEAEHLAGLKVKDDDGISFSEMIAEGGDRFRFPFPDEDGMNHRELITKEFNKSFSLISEGVEIEHGVICVSQPKPLGGTYNLFVPCPYGDQFRELSQSGGLRLSHGGAGLAVMDASQEANRRGKVRTVFTCPMCGNSFTLTDEDVEIVREQSAKYYEQYNTEGKPEGYEGNQELFDYATRVIERIK